MKFTLLTYDSILAHNAGYAHSENAVSFLRTLSELVEEFSVCSGVLKQDINWVLVADSDWCKNCLLLWAKVDANWLPAQPTQPASDTDVVDDSFDPTGFTWFGDTARPFRQWVTSKQTCVVNIKTYPPETPHSLFRTKQIS